MGYLYPYLIPAIQQIPFAHDYKCPVCGQIKSDTAVIQATSSRYGNEDGGECWIEIILCCDKTYMIENGC